MPKKAVSTTKFHTVKKRRQPGPSWKADCARMKKHQLKIAARTSRSARSLTRGDEVIEAARTCRSLRNAAQPARLSTQQKWSTPKMKPTVRSEYVAGGAHSLRSQGGEDGGGNGGGGAGGGLLKTLPMRVRPRRGCGNSDVPRRRFSINARTLWRQNKLGSPQSAGFPFPLTTESPTTH